jgi:hypothetical protein
MIGERCKKELMPIKSNSTLAIAGRGLRLKGITELKLLSNFEFLIVNQYKNEEIFNIPFSVPSFFYFKSTRPNKGWR